MRDEDSEDEGPSDEDIDRFGHDTAYCPDCGAEVWDAAEVCPTCHAYLGGNAESLPPITREWQRRWIILIVIALLAAFLMWTVIFWMI